jgi:hypothetical protein
MADKEYAPWSRETSDGLITSAVDSHVRVSQDIVPALNVGTIDRLTGKWEGAQVSDSLFLVDPTHEAVANGAAVLSPQRSDHEYIDMTGFNQLFIAINASNAGNYAIQAVMGPDSYPFANLNPVDAAALLKGSNPSATGNATSDLFNDAAEALTANVWNIFIIGGNSTTGELGNQKLLQFKLTNNSGGPSNIQFASLRVV